MAYCSPKRLTAMERVMRDGKERKTKNTKTELPGVSYIPFKMEIAEDTNVQEKVSLEFIDFLDCVTDLLRLMSMLRARHLRSVKPLPFAVIRDIQKKKSKSQALKQFEKNVDMKGISDSVENLLQTSKSAASTVANMGTRHRNKLKKPNLKDRSTREMPDLSDILGKKTKPIWQVVIMEKPKAMADADVKQMMDKREKATEDRDTHRILKNNTSASTGVFKTKSEEMLCNIQYMRSFRLAECPEYEEQMDMIEAYFDGFTSVDEHKRYLETFSPHWFTDLLKLSLDTGIVLCQPVVDAYRRLGELYNFNHSDPFARGKLCFILQSLPIWDVTRVTMQRATEFILRDVLNAPAPSKDTHDWLTARRLPYVVLPPIMSSFYNEFGEKATTEVNEDKPTKEKAHRRNSDAQSSKYDTSTFALR